MRRSDPPLAVVLLLAAAAPSAATADPGDPRPAKGRAAVVVSDPVSRKATFVAGRTTNVTVVYRRRGSASRPVQLAARFGTAGKRCSARPSSADRRRVGGASADPAGRSFVSGLVQARFLSGTTRTCVWAREGSGSFGRPTTSSLSFARTLFAATTAEGPDTVLPEFALNAYRASSTSPLAGTIMDETPAGDGCEFESKPVRSLPSTGIHVAGLTSSNRAGRCNRFSVQVAGEAGSAAVSVGPTPVGAPARVVEHVGDCNPDILDVITVPRATIGSFLTAAGCRLGRTIDARNERRKGMPADRQAFAAVFRGKRVDLAPRGTVVDVLVDTRR